MRRFVLPLAGVLFGLCVHGEETEDTFLRALEPRVFAFPRDFASHPPFKTEWWYLTGALESADGDLFGYQATWFRSALTREKLARASRLAPRDLFLFHGALSDVAAKRFVYEHRICRGAANWAGAAEDKLNVFLLGQTLREEPDGSWRLRVKIEGRALDLTLTSTREPLLHGQEPGLSRKGPDPGQASYYVSRTRLKTAGTLEREPGGAAVRVSGFTWYDQEFGSNQLAANQSGWDWFSARLDDGTDLMLYQLRRDDGSIEPISSGTVRLPDGERVHLERKDFAIEVLARWKSPHTGAAYPSKWKLSVPRAKLELTAEPYLADQELHDAGAAGVVYWEGLTRYEGARDGTKVSGRGYVELVGYAGKIRGF